jgi:hypothetical protein
MTKVKGDHAQSLVIFELSSNCHPPLNYSLSRFFRKPVSTFRAHQPGNLRLRFNQCMECVPLAFFRYRFRKTVVAVGICPNLRSDMAGGPPPAAFLSFAANGGADGGFESGPVFSKVDPPGIWRSVSSVNAIAGVPNARPNSSSFTMRENNVRNG